MFKGFKIIVSIMLIFIILSVPVFGLNDMATGQSLGITSKGAVLIDLNTETILYKRNMNQQCRPASLTKMMTLLVAYEQTLGRHDQLVQLTEEMISVPSGSSSANLKNKDMISIGDLFYAMMLPSGNDAAKALAYVVSGSQENFALLMNEKARELGMTNSNFKNSHGFDQDGHFTTAYDLALLSCALCKNPELVKIFSTLKYTATIYPNGDTDVTTTQNYYNTNKMLFQNAKEYFEGCKGIKTGYTALAGNCLSTYYELNGRKLVAVITFSEQGQRDNDMAMLLKYGINNFDSLNLREVFSQQKIIVDLENAAKSDESNGQLELYLTHPQEDKYITVSASEGKKIRTFDENTISIRYPVLSAPQYAGDQVGVVEYVYDNQVIYSVPAQASRSVDKEIESPLDLVSLGIKGKARFSLGFLLSPYFLIPFFAVLILGGAGFFIVHTNKKQRLRIRARQKNADLRGRRRRNSSRPGDRSI